MLQRAIRQSQISLHITRLAQSAFAQPGQSAVLHTDADWALCRISAESERASTVCVQGGHTITIDHPVDQGGKDMAPGPVAHFLGSLIGAQQASLYAVASEQHLTLGKVSWTAEAKMDARGVFGEGSVPAEFDSVSLRADVETELSADRLAELRAASLKRCVVANTLAKAGVTLDVVFTRKSAWMFKSSMGTYIP